MSERPGNTLLLAAALSLAGFALAAVIAVAPSLARATQGTPAPSRVFDRTFDLRGITELRVRGSSSDIEIAPSQSREAGFHSSGAPEGDTLALHGSLRSLDAHSLDDFTVTYVRDGNVATLTLTEPASSSYISNRFALALTPSRTLDVQSASGDVAIDAPTAATTVRNGSGDVRVSDASAPLDLQSSSGELKVKRASARVSARSSSGDLTIDDAKSELDLASSSGGVSAELDRAWSGNAIAITTSSGDVDLKVPANLHASLHTATTSGDVSNDAHLSSNVPGAPTIAVQTSSGDVDVTTRE